MSVMSDVLCWLVLRRSGLLPPEGLLHTPEHELLYFLSGRKGHPSVYFQLCRDDERVESLAMDGKLDGGADGQTQGAQCF